MKLVLFHEGLPRSNETEVLDLAREQAIAVVDSGHDELPKLPDDPHYASEGNRMVAARLLPKVMAALAAH